MILWTVSGWHASAQQNHSGSCGRHVGCHACTGLDDRDRGFCIANRTSESKWGSLSHQHRKSPGGSFLVCVQSFVIVGNWNSSQKALYLKLFFFFILFSYHERETIKCSKHFQNIMWKIKICIYNFVLNCFLIIKNDQGFILNH